MLLLLIFSMAAPLKSQENKLAEKWVEGMNQELPKALCVEKMYFRQCFQITEIECKNQALQSFNKCLSPSKAELYQKFGKKGTKELSSEGAYWGGKLGECTGIDYEKTLITKRINSAKCNDPKNWVGN